jgi:hypothetical protein
VLIHGRQRMSRFQELISRTFYWGLNHSFGNTRLPELSVFIALIGSLPQQHIPMPGLATVVPVSR